MIGVDKMKLDALQTGWEKLRQIDYARYELKGAAEAAVKDRYGVQGISDNRRFVDNVLRLFDEHVEHLVKREQSRIEAAVFPSEPNGEKDASVT